jgi:hypothetical protein
MTDSEIAAVGVAAMPLAPRSPLDDARAHDTLPDRLRELADRYRPTRRNHQGIYEAIVANPNAPADLLIEFGPQYWPALFRNPVGPLLPLEVPDLLERVGDLARRDLLRLTGVPEWLLRWAAGSERLDPQFALEARLHVGLAGEAGKNWEERLRKALKRVADVATPAQRAAHAEMVALNFAPAWIAGSGAAEAGDEAAPTDATPGLLLPGDLRERAAEAAAPGTPPERLLHLVTLHPHEVVWLAAASNPAANYDVLSALLRLGRAVPELRRAVARHPATSASLLERLAGDRDVSVRRAALRHPNAPADAVARARAAALTMPDAPLCRLAALLDPHASPPHRVHEAVESRYWTERLAAALRGREGLKKLAADGNAFVRAAARARDGGAKIDFKL